VRVNPDNLHEDIWSVIEPSEGVLLYQEQMLRVLKTVGLKSTDLTRALKAVKASNKKVAKAQREVDQLLMQIKDLATPKGWKTRDYNWLKTAFEAYANYGFNLAHATSYGLLAYRTAWLSYMYPGEFWQAMITAFEDDADKVKEHTSALQERGFSKMPIDVNKSESHIKVDVISKRIYPALTSIKGIGQIQADKIAACAPYQDLDDFTKRLLPSGVTGIKSLASGTPVHECQGVVGYLFHAGAFRSIM
jgi:DNA polymerase III subunit alpha